MDDEEEGHRLTRQPAGWLQRTADPEPTCRLAHSATTTSGLYAPADGGAGQLGHCPKGPPHTHGTQLGSFPREAQKGARVLLMPPLLVLLALCCNVVSRGRLTSCFAAVN